MRKISIGIGITLFLFLSFSFNNKRERNKQKETYTAYVVPIAKEVTAGTFYEADIITVSPTDIKPVITTSIGEVYWEEGIAKVRFKASGKKYDKFGKFHKFWEAKLSFSRPKKEDTTITIITGYKVKKPVIKVFYYAPLYRNCGNPLKITIPELGPDCKLTFISNEADIRLGRIKRDIIVLPHSNSRRVIISISSNGTMVGTEMFKVQPIPLPTVIVKLNGKYLDQKRGYDDIGKGIISFKIRPEMNFISTLPSESKYQVTNWSATLVRNGIPVTTPALFNTRTEDLSNLFSQSKPNDRILIEVLEVIRTNFKGETEKVRLGTEIFNVLIN